MLSPFLGSQTQSDWWRLVNKQELRWKLLEPIMSILLASVQLLLYLGVEVGLLLGTNVMLFTC